MTEGIRMRKRALIIIIIGTFIIFQSLFAQSWEKSRRLTWSADSTNPDVANDTNENIHVVWKKVSNIYHKRSTNGGVTWSGNKRLDWGQTSSYPPAVATDSNNNVHVVWYSSAQGNLEIYYKNSTNEGVSWSSIKRLTWTSTGSRAPDIATDPSNNIHIVWLEKESFYPDNSEIYYKNSTNGGISWSGAKRLTWFSSHSGWPTIVSDSNGNICVAFDSDKSGNYEIYFKRSTDGGTSWSGAKRVTWNSGDSRQPSIATDSSNNINIVWYDWTPGNMEIYYKKSTNGGVSWTGTRRFTWNSSDSWRQSIGIDQLNHVHVVWQDNTSGNNEIYYKRSPNGGTTWDKTERLTWNSGLSLRAKIASYTKTQAGGGGPTIYHKIHIVWTDTSPGNYEIFYKYGSYDH
jgi:hypothetical protein